MADWKGTVLKTQSENSCWCENRGKRESELVLAEVWLLGTKGKQLCDRLPYSHHTEVHEPPRPGLHTYTESCIRSYTGGEQTNMVLIHKNWQVIINRELHPKISSRTMSGRKKLVTSSHRVGQYAANRTGPNIYTEMLIKT